MPARVVDAPENPQGVAMINQRDEIRTRGTQVDVIEVSAGENPAPEEPKLTVAEALAWLDDQTFATEGDSTEIVREMRDAR